MYYLSMTKGVVTNGSIDHLRKGNSRRRWGFEPGPHWRGEASVLTTAASDGIG